MNFSKQHFFFLLLFLPLLSASEPKRCYSSSCGGNSLDVRFPFWLFPNHSASCGYPGFNLYCTNRHETALNLPNSGPFLVREIKSQRIRLNDPDKCLARRLLSFNASESPFSPLHLLNYTFLTCPNQDVKSSSIKPIHCLGNSTTSIFATPLDHVSSMPPSCQVFKTLLLPVSSPLAIDLNDQDLWLKWDSPDCTKCDDFTPLCGFINNTTLQVKCFAYVDSGNPWLITLKIFSICLSIPFFLFVTPALLIIFLPIEQAKTVETSESVLVPWPNDTLCSICLSEYTSKETIKSLPECKHCFHVECINPWLKLHNSCPICRNSPSQVTTNIFLI